MLSELTIKSFAIIDELTLSFSEGLNVLSGETGAGKSIIINAINLIQGRRTSADIIGAMRKRQ
jgi:DNA repair protein RecN (Recombination protein N)